MLGGVEWCQFILTLLVRKNHHHDAFLSPAISTLTTTLTLCPFNNTLSDMMRLQQGLCFTVIGSQTAISGPGEFSREIVVGTVPLIRNSGKFSVHCWNCSINPIFPLVFGTVPLILFFADFWYCSINPIFPPIVGTVPSIRNSGKFSIHCWNCSINPIFPSIVGTVPLI